MYCVSDLKWWLVGIIHILGLDAGFLVLILILSRYVLFLLSS